MNKKSYTILYIFIFCFTLNQVQANNTPEIKDGIIDISEYNFKDKAVIKLNGNWEFYWKKLYYSSDFKNQNIKQKVYFQVPAYWHDSTKSSKNNKYTDFGYATYRLTVISDTMQLLSFNLKEILTSYAIYVNGKLETYNGTVGKTDKEAVPQYIPKTFTTLLHAGKNEVILHVSNFSHRWGGVFSEIEIGNTEKIENKRIRSIALDIFVFGSLLIMVLYHLNLFFHRRKDFSSLFFAIYVFIVVIRSIFTSEEFYTYIFPNICWDYGYKVDYLTFYLGLPTMVLFLTYTFRKVANMLYTKICFAISTIFSLIVIFTNATIYTQTLYFYQLFTLIYIIYVTIIMIKSIKLKLEGAYALLIGSVIFFITSINDILYYNMMFTKTMELSSIGLVFFVLSQSYILSVRFTNSFKRNEILTQKLDYQNKNLERIVDERTTEILAQKEEIRAQAENLEEANKELEKLSIVAQKTDNAVIISNINAEIEWVNYGFTKLTGYTLDEFKEKHGKTLFEGSSYSNFEKLFTQCIENKKTVYYTSKITHKNGSIRWVQTTLTPIVNLNNTVEKLIAVDSDISKVKEAEQKIQVQNVKIKDSIIYAERIQNALLPPSSTIKKLLPNAFVLFMPKDIVSGDFYWVKEVNNKTLVAAIDCTGHGVPGAFMSLIGNSLLEQITNEKKLDSPNLILDELKTNLLQKLENNPNSELNDGMDMALIAINHAQKQIQFAGAYNPLFLFRNNELTEYKANKFPIGRFYKPINKPFKLHTINYQEGDMLYIFSDGYQDQLNEDFDKFYSANFKKLLQNIHQQPIKEQKQSLLAAHNSFKKTMNQTDDIIIIGIKL